MNEKDEMRQRLGQKLKLLRRSQGLTLQELGEQVGCSAAFLSMVENGHSSISLPRLQRLLQVYGTSMGYLLDESQSQARVVPLEAAPLLGGDRSSEGVEARVLVQWPAGKRIEPIWFHLEPQAVLGPLQHEGEEFCYVIEGKFQVTLEDPDSGAREEYCLSAGDTIYYESRLLHTWRNRSQDRDGCFLGAVTPPSF